MPTNPQHIVLFHHFRRVLEAAARENIAIAPLKGAHLLTSVYPPDRDRGMMSDVDFLVKPADYLRTVALMETLGFTRRDHFADEGQLFEMGFYYDLGEGRQILFELHRYLFEHDRFPLDHESIWDRAVPSDFEGVPCLRLSAEDHFCHIALHTVLHRLAGLERSVDDLRLLVESGTLRLEEVVERAREWRVTRSVWFFLDYLAEICPEQHLENHATAIEPPKPIVVWFRMLGKERTREWLARTHHRVQAAVIWPFMFDSPVQVARFVTGHPLVWKMLGRA